MGIYIKFKNHESQSIPAHTQTKLDFDVDIDVEFILKRFFIVADGVGDGLLSLSTQILVLLSNISYARFSLWMAFSSPPDDPPYTFERYFR